MANVEARIKVKGKEYQISVDLDEALKVKKGEGDITRALNSNHIFYDVKKGTKVSEDDLENSFGTSDVFEIAEKIIKEGEVQKTQEFRDSQREEKIKKVVNLILKNAVDQHGKPFTEDRIRRAIDEVSFSFDNKPVEKQMYDLVDKIKVIMPIKIETKRIKIIVPARFTGQAYGLLQDNKESEEWLSNGDLAVIVRIPAGMQLDFYDKINSVTHGAVQSEELKE